MKRITVLLGHYGSGKTEIALQMALDSADSGARTGLVDMDIVNPYFRSGEQSELLASRGIEVIMPNYEGTAVDVPSLPAEVRRIFTASDTRYICDAGGEIGGASVLGSYAKLLAAEDCETYAVVNTMRPWTDTPENIASMIEKMRGLSRLPMAGIIHNTNLAAETEPWMIMEGQKRVEQAAEALGIPVTHISVTEKVLRGLPDDFTEQYGDKLFRLTVRMRPDWLDEIF